METSAPKFKKFLLVCENEREAGACCNPAGTRLREALKARVKERGLAAKLRVSRTGCLDTCEEGPNVLLMPDNVWFKRVTDADLDAILRRAEEGL